MSIRKVFQIVLLVLMPSYCLAAVDTFEFVDDEQKQRYQQFIDEMRCPKCQNQNLSGSDSPIATDLRKQLYVMVGAGKSDDEIIQYMTDRYGDFILYNPRLSYKTILLWGAPIVFALIGLLILLIMLKSRKTMVSNVRLSEKEQAELDYLLLQYSNKSNQKSAGE